MRLRSAGDDADSSASDKKPASRSATGSTGGSGAGNTNADDLDEAGTAGATAGDQAPPPSSDADAPSTDVPPAQEGDETQIPVSGDFADRKASNTSRNEHANSNSFADTSGAVQSPAIAATPHDEKTPQELGTSGRADAPTTFSFTTTSIDGVKSAATTFSAPFAPTAPAEPEAPTSVVSIVTDLLGSLLHPLLYPGTGSPPLQAPTLMAILAAVRDEIERILFPRQAPPAPPQTGQPPVYPDPPADPTEQHVLVIAIDGTNLSRVLADEEEMRTSSS